MSLEEIKSQVESAVRRLFKMQRSRERDALDFVLALLRRCVLDGSTSPDPGDSIKENPAAETAVDQRGASPDPSDHLCNSSPPSPICDPSPKRRSQRKRASKKPESTVMSAVDSATPLLLDNSPPPSPMRDRSSKRQNQRKRTSKKSEATVVSAVNSVTPSFLEDSSPPSPLRVPSPKIQSERKRVSKRRESSRASAAAGLSTRFSLLRRELARKRRTHVHCSVCTEWAAPRRRLLQHLADHDGTAVCCRVCRHTFSNLTVMALHRELSACVAASHPPGKPLVFRRTTHLDNFNFAKFAVCPFCGGRFSNASNLHAHMRRNACTALLPRERPDQSTKCTLCPKLFPTPDHLDEHRQKVHSHKCTICDEVFTTVQLMKKHRHTCAADKASKVSHKCKKCDKSFSKRTELRAHNREHAEPKQKDKQPAQHVCGACGWRTSRAFNLARHERAHAHGAPGAAPPAPPAPHACHRCPALLRSAASLGDHLRAHAAECRFVCAECGRGFRRRGALRRHVARHGARAARHACARCPRAFVRRDHLARHLRETHDRRRTHRVRAGKAPQGGAEARAGAASVQEAAPAPAKHEPQFLSLLDVQSGEMFTVPSHFAYKLLCEEPRAEWGGAAGVATLLPPADNIVLLTNVTELLPGST